LSNPFLIINKTHPEVELKSHHPFEYYKPSLVYYTVTASKNIYAINIEDLHQTKQLHKKKISEFNPDEIIQSIFFLGKADLLIVYARSVKCVVSYYSNDWRPSRSVNVGFDMIGDITSFNFYKFFAVAHPQKKNHIHFGVP
jgi:hypothetical protein